MVDTTQGKTQVSQTSNAAADYIAEIKSSTHRAIDSGYFPFLKQVPNIIQMLMNTWQAESSFHLHFPNNSRHPQRVDGLNSSIGTPQKGGFKTSFNKDWLQCTAVNAYRNQGGYNAEAINDGMYPHGLSAVIGAYHVRNTPCFNYAIGNPAYVGLSTSLGLICDVGDRIIDLYATDDATTRYKSIVAGCMLYEAHYKNITSTSNPSLRFQKAAGAYLGSGTDVNGETAAHRTQVVLNNTKYIYQANRFSQRVVIAETDSEPTNMPGCTAAA